MCTGKGALKIIHAVRNSKLYLLQVKESHLLTKLSQGSYIDFAQT